MEDCTAQPPSMREKIDHWFAYHKPKDDAVVQSHTLIREAGRQMALVIASHTPTSADQSAAIRQVREAVMTANAAIACEGR